MTNRVWSPDEVRALGVRTDLPTAASVLGIGRNAAYDLARQSGFPVPVFRVGVRYVVPVAPLLELLGVDPKNSEAGPASPAVAPPSSPIGGARHDDRTVQLREVGGPE
jgi:hypothetical protein